MTRVGLALLTVVGGACLALGCSGATPRDQNFNTDAGADFVPPPPSFDTGVDDTATGVAGAGGAGGDLGAAGAGGSAGAAGAGTSSSDADTDTDTDAASDGGAP